MSAFLDRLRSRRFLIGSAAALALLAAGAYFAAGLAIYNKLSLVPRGPSPHAGNTPTNFSVHLQGWEDFDVSPYLLPGYETVRIPSRESGIGLVGWYAHNSADSPAVVLVHGLGDRKECHWVLIPAGMLFGAGFSVLAVDLRDHGDSDLEDGRTAIGNEEYLDVLGAWDWLAREKGVPPERIGLYGTSLGASTVLIAAGEEARVAAVFADSPFSDLAKIIDEELKRNGYPTFLAPGGILVARLLAGDSLLAKSPEGGVRGLKGRPLYLVHGLADGRIGVHHSRRLQTVAEEEGVSVATWFVPEADHLEAMLRHPEEYRRRLTDFFREALAGR